MRKSRPGKGAITRGGFDPHARKKTKRFRDTKPGKGGRAGTRDDDRSKDDRRHDDRKRSGAPGFAKGKFGGERPPFRDRNSRSGFREKGFRDKNFRDKPFRDKPEAESVLTVPEKPKPAFASAGVQTVTVTADENDMRVDRFFEARFPGLSFSHIQRIIRKGEVRVNGKRTEPKSRLAEGQQVRIPPLKVEPPKPRDDAPGDLKDRAFIKSITLYEDDDVMVLNKPMGLAVQGGSGTTRHVDGMLAALTPMGRDAQRPRLVHRLDKDTAGCLLVAKTRFAAAALAKTFRSRAARKIYWALVYGVPKPKQGRISTFLAKEQMEEDSYMRIAGQGEDGASHAVTYYAVVENSAQQLSWVSLKPVTGRTHQLRAHMAHLKNPIVGDPKYFNIENWHRPGGIQDRLHLLARRIAVPHPRGGKTIDITAPLPPHMEQTWNLLGLDAKRYDPIEDSPED
jgi:23S rRNA pseudouridine955/2504/2580 synthase